MVCIRFNGVSLAAVLKTDWRHWESGQGQKQGDQEASVLQHPVATGGGGLHRSGSCGGGKKRIQHVYGAQHPPFDPLLHGTLLKSTAKMPTTPVKAKRVSTFQEFESNTSDAWDAGEDDDELLAMAAESLNSEVVMETANRVLRNHSQRQGRPTLQEGPGLQQKPRPEAEPPSPPSGDLRLVKSVSESHTSCPAESASDAAPLQRSQSLPHAATVTLGGTSDPSTLSSSALSEREASRLDKFKQLLAGPNTDLEELRKLSWSGIPKPVRPMTWKLLSGYLPANVDRRPATLQRKQKEYFAFIEHYYDSRNDEVHQDTYRQIHIDIPRMSPEALILQPKVTEIFERILFIWAIRHPASGYVQGINDLVTPFFVVFICEYIEISRHVTKQETQMTNKLKKPSNFTGEVKLTLFQSFAVKQPFWKAVWWPMNSLVSPCPKDVEGDARVHGGGKCLHELRLEPAQMIIDRGSLKPLGTLIPVSP
ncbi:PREDICTED: TBC1 domain family member 22A isoform X7 [Rhinopithecus bieti]|uniref:TBC1 domain family member 22A isoform X7 n=1 Tax=Rhinopithecus bieti TaxID=61621 RepID=UPI00083C3145|nr:PREDICTED: TBC1 domain family member 22A isoform X7 [Rhinopithecus bieti]